MGETVRELLSVFRLGDRRTGELLRALLWISAR